MIRITLKIVLMLGLLAVLIVSVAGCTSNTANTTPTPTQTQTGSTGNGSTQYNAVTYANAYLNDNIKPAFLGQTIVSANVHENGSKGATISVVIQNTTEYNITTTISLNVQQFSSTNDATAAFNARSVGDTLSMPSSTAMENPASAAYKDTTGNAPTVSNSGYAINGEQISTITQQGEFVTWGTSSFN
jgi:hypothetical protein